MIDLLSIQDTVQQIADAISIIVRVDVEVMNTNSVRIAGTGKFSAGIGEKITYNYIYQKVAEEGTDILILNPRDNEICQPCPGKRFCQEYAELCSPIFFGDMFIGVFGIIAFNEKQRDFILYYQEELKSFIKHMGRMLAAEVAENQYTQKLQIAGAELEAVINSINEGILAINNTGIITHCNDSGTRLLSFNNSKEISNQQIGDIIPNSPLTDVLKTGRTYINIEVIHNTNNNRLLFTARPIMSNNQVVGAVASFRTVEEVKELILDYTTHNFPVPLESIIGNSPVMMQLREKVLIFANNSSTILIRGESGTGKELFARAIHSKSPRRNKPFIAVNCSAIPDTLLESELFGYEEGAFSGAKKHGKPGKFEMANGGTIFLDEVGDMPIHLQVKILRTLQEKTIDRVGGSSSITLNLRIIAATNRPLEDMISRGEFREDLYYRLNVIPLYIPPLRERKEDIVPLLTYLTSKYNRLFNKKIESISNEARDIILAYDWPGNIRELENAIEYSFNIECSNKIQFKSLPEKLTNKKPQADSKQLKTINELEKEAIKNALDTFGRSLECKNTVAEMLGISIATLYRKIKQYKL